MISPPITHGEPYLYCSNVIVAKHLPPTETDFSVIFVAFR